MTSRAFAIQFNNSIPLLAGITMNLWKIAWRSIQQRSLASLLTGFSMALGVALVVAVLVIGQIVKKSFASGSSLGYNVIVGAKGGRLDLLLNTVYYLNRPIENIPWEYYQGIPACAINVSDHQDGKFASDVEVGNSRVLGRRRGRKWPVPRRGHNAGNVQPNCIPVILAGRRFQAA